MSKMDLLGDLQIHFLGLFALALSDFSYWLYEINETGGNQWKIRNRA